MRLTLRTLLAYLDDTLEPTEIKQIGQKVAESDAAQELIARIKQITRRRRLTTPPSSGPGGANFDPNTVAEYLDNALSGEQIADVEKLCLESDVHLAEIATCHQILTLVLGEPALVPPTARERMYGLVKGKESIPFRKAFVAAPQSANSGGGLSDDSDESPVGLALRRGGWPRWVLPAAGVLLVAGLVLTLIKIMPGAPRSRQLAANSQKKAENDTPVVTPSNGQAGEPERPEVGQEKQPAKEAGADVAKKADASSPKPTEPSTGSKEKPPVKDTVADAGKNAANASPSKPTDASAGAAAKQPDATTAAGSSPPSEQAGAPLTERRQVGTYKVAARSGPTLLVDRQNDQTAWRRLSPDTRVYATDSLVSLPGFLSEVWLDSGVHLQMRGLLPEFSSDPTMNLLPDSSVVIHSNKDVDLDLTLNHGRVYISNHKEQGAARVRIRFEHEIWFLTLAEPDSEVLVELIKRYTGDIRWQDGDEPWAAVWLGFIKGKGSLKADFLEFPMQIPGPAFCNWDNKTVGLQGPRHLQQPFTQWDKAPPTNKDAEQMTTALEDLSKRMTDKKSVDVALMEGLQSNRKSSRLLAIRCLGAIDEIDRLLDILGDEDDSHGLDRITAVSVIRQWLSQSPEMGKMLYDAKKRSGLLTKNGKYQPAEAETVLKLLYGFNIAEIRSPDTYRVLADYMSSSPRIAIRELAVGHLLNMGAPVVNPAWPENERQKSAIEINRLVDEHKLPPPPRSPAGTGGAAPSGAK